MGWGSCRKVVQYLDESIIDSNPFKIECFDFDNFIFISSINTKAKSFFISVSRRWDQNFQYLETVPLTYNFSRHQNKQKIKSTYEERVSNFDNNVDCLIICLLFDNSPL